MREIDVLVIARADAVTEKLCKYISSDGSMTLLERCSTGARGLRRASALRPGVIILDMHLPGEDCLGLVEELRAASGAAVVAMSATTSVALRALNAGAADFMHIPAGAVASDRDWFSSDAVRRVKIAVLGAPCVLPETEAASLRRPGLLVLSCARGGPVPPACVIGKMPAGGPPVLACRRADGFTAVEYREMLSSTCDRVISEGRDGMELKAGTVAVVEPGDAARVQREGGRLILRMEKDGRPGAGGLLRSAAGTLGAEAAGVVLAGGEGYKELIGLSEAGGFAAVEYKNALLRDEGYRPPNGIPEMPLEDIATAIAFLCCHSGRSIE